MREQRDGHPVGGDHRGERPHDAIEGQTRLHVNVVIHVQVVVIDEKIETAYLRINREGRQQKSEADSWIREGLPPSHRSPTHDLEFALNWGRAAGLRFWKQGGQTLC